jgi:hypothetical protein
METKESRGNILPPTDECSKEFSVKITMNATRE